MFSNIFHVWSKGAKSVLRTERVFAESLNTCLKATDLFLRKWRQYAQGLLPMEVILAKSSLDVNF